MASPVNNNNNNDGSNMSSSQPDSKLIKKISKKIVLKVVLLGDEDPLRVKVKTSTKWEKIFRSFGDYKGREVKFLRFCYDGARIRPNQTVGEVVDDLDDDDDGEVQIDVMYEQQGGN